MLCKNDVVQLQTWDIPSVTGAVVLIAVLLPSGLQPFMNDLDGSSYVAFWWNQSTNPHLSGFNTPGRTQVEPSGMLSFRVSL